MMLSWPTNDRQIRVYKNSVMVYSDWTRQRQFDGVKHVALVLKHILITRSIHTGRAALWFLYYSDAVVLKLARPVCLDPKGAFRLRVYSDRTRQRQNDGVKHYALDLEHMLVNRSIQTGRVASKNLYNKDAVVLTLARPVWIDLNAMRLKATKSDLGQAVLSTFENPHWKQSLLLAFSRVTLVWMYLKDLFRLDATVSIWRRKIGFWNYANKSKHSYRTRCVIFFIQ